LKKASEALSEALDKVVTKNILKSALKCLDYTWKRFRKTLKKKQDNLEYEEKLNKLLQLFQLSQKGHVDLFFGDESSFNMEGYVPYGWQPKGEYIQITPSKTPSTKVFGLMDLQERLYAYTSKENLNTEAVITFIEDFWKQHRHPCVIVLDNAPIHKSKVFLKKVEEWNELDLYIFFLPKYSPHLNPIEILWRKMKYEWIPYESIEKQQQLDNTIDEIK
jgi:hypothetical protein